MREEKALKWIDGAVIVAAVATVPLVVIEARAVSSPVTVYRTRFLGHTFTLRGMA